MTVNCPDCPPYNDECWPVLTDCCDNFENYPQDIRERAVAFAGLTMRMLTGYSVGGCPVVLRPCSPSCAQRAGWAFTGSAFQPHINGLGQWVNACGCPGFDCDCSFVSEVVLPGHAGSIVEVRVDGQVVDTSLYRVDNGNRLVSMGDPWPTCQDMTAPTTEPGTFSVSYRPGIEVDGSGAFAAGVLACEFAKGCSGEKCRLPAGVTQVVRSGVSMTLSAGAFPKGKTGIREVDAYIERYNPHGLKVPSTVWSPDLKRGRVTTWSHHG